MDREQIEKTLIEQLELLKERSRKPEISNDEFVALTYQIIEICRNLYQS